MDKIKKVFDGVSLKKYLITVLCTVMITSFIGFTMLFISASFQNITAKTIHMNENNEEMVKVIKVSQEGQIKEIKEGIERRKSEYGEDYPAEEILFFEISTLLSSSYACEIYVLSIDVGIILGTVIYIVFVQKAKGVQMVLELLTFALILTIIFVVVDFGYMKILTIMIGNEIGVNSIEYEKQFADVDINTYIKGYISITIVVYIINLAYQGILANKLNKKLNNK